MNSTLGRWFVRILFLATLGCAVQAQTRWQLPATIQALQDVSVEPYPQHPPVSAKRPRDVIYIGRAEKGFKIKKGETFQMTKILPESNCAFRFKGHTYETSYCYWLDGFADHHSDVFVVTKGRIPSDFSR
jgi:hypothetical protein